MIISTDLLSLKYDVYIRRSSDDDSHQTASIERQKSELRQLISENNLPIQQQFEESRSAKKPDNRPQFNELVKRINAGEINAIITWDVSRLSRNPQDDGAIWWLLQSEKIKAIITPFRIYRSEDNAMLLSVEFRQANQYIRDLIKNVKSGLKHKLNLGNRPGMTPEGYVNDCSHGKGNSTIVDDLINQPFIRKMWDLLLTGAYSVPQIRALANDEWHFRTRKHPNTGGKPLSRANIYRMFNNPFYYGWFE